MSRYNTGCIQTERNVLVVPPEKVKIEYFFLEIIWMLPVTYAGLWGEDIRKECENKKLTTECYSSEHLAWDLVHLDLIFSC